jgi:hypothetical protein
MLRVVEQPFLVDVAVVFVVEALLDGLDQAADDLLKTVQGRDQIDFDDGAVPGIDDDGSHGGVLCFVGWSGCRKRRIHAASRAASSSVCGCRLLRKSAAFCAWLAAAKIARVSFFDTVSQEAM